MSGLRVGLYMKLLRWDNYLMSGFGVNEFVDGSQRFNTLAADLLLLKVFESYLDKISSYVE